MIYHDDSHVLATSFDYRHNPSWRVFRIMAEFIDGFTFLSSFSKTVTFFGSTRLKSDHKMYQHAQKLAYSLSKDGYTILTGGGPGIMEAANKGAYEAGGESVGINIQLPNSQRTNPYVKKSIALNYFFVRRVLLAFSASAFICYPGGFGTLDEMFEISTLIQTGKLEHKVPIVLIDGDFWQPLIDWTKKSMIERYQTLNKAELRIWSLVDSIEEAKEIVESKIVK